jgi:UDP-glucose 4-epimerase
VKVLVTGGFGYVGGRLAQTLASCGHSVVLGSRHAHPSPPWLPGATVARLDWDNLDQLCESCASVDAVAHLAGSNATESAADPTAALAFNGVATSRLVRAATRAGVRRFLYLSTAHVYGSPLRGLVNEATCPSPRHPYATSHRAGEDLVRAAHDDGHVEGIVVRLSNAFGPPAHLGADCWTLLVNDLCRQAVESGRMVLKSSGVQRRDFVSMREAARALIHLLELPRERQGNGVFNVGGGWSPTVMEMAERVAHRVAASMKKQPRIERGPAGAGERDEELRYERAKLIDTGFVPASPDATDAEIDALVLFCVSHFSRPTS